MRIRMLTGIAGINWSAIPGDEIDRERGEALRLIAAGAAEPVETATVGPSEIAAIRTRPPQPRRSGNRRRA